MTADTILNAAAVFLTLVAAILAGMVFYFIHSNREDVHIIQTAVAKLQQTSSDFSEECRELNGLLKDTGDWVAQYKHVLSNNVDLNKQIDKLTRSNEVLHGQTVELTNMLQNVNGVVRAQWTALERRDRAIGDLVPLVDQLTKALDEKAG